MGGIVQAFQHWVELNPDQTAIRFLGHDLSYGAIDRAADEAASALARAGIGAGDRFGFHDLNSHHFFVLMLAACKLGAIIVPVNFRLAPAESAFVVKDAGIRMLFVGKAFGSQLEAMKAEMGTAVPIVIIDFEDMTNHWIADLPNLDRSAAPDIAALRGGIFAILYSSGTTGRPKGVPQSEQKALALLDVWQKGWADFGADDIALGCLPSFHISGLLVTLIPLINGSTLLLRHVIDPADLINAITLEGVTKAVFVPAIINMLINSPAIEGKSFPGLKLVAYGASPIATDTLVRAQKAFGCDFFQIYGLTENMGGTTVLNAMDHQVGGDRLISCGKALPGAEIRIQDDKGNPLAIGEIGEIATRSPWVMDGYLNRPEANAESLVDGWFLTGDAGYLDGEGYLYIHDRIGDMIISGAENIYPVEVENALMAHPDIADVAVFGIPDDKWGEAVAAAVVVHPGTEPSGDELTEFLRRRIAHFKVPKKLDFIRSIPRNASGKALRRELRAPYWWQGHER